MGALGIHRSKALWKGVVLNVETNRYRGGTGIITTPSLYDTIIKSVVVRKRRT